jgi:hypothetical protein
MRSSRGRFFLKALLFLLIFVVLVWALGFALAPAESFTRLMLHDLYAQEGGIEAAFIGASHALYGLDTQALDKSLGARCFNLGSASQKALDSFYLLKEMYGENKPKLVVIEVTYAMYTRFSGYDNPTSSMILYDYYRPGANKLAYLGAAFTPEDYPDVFLKAYRYRSRFPEIFDTLGRKLTAEYFSYDPAVSSYEDERYAGKGFVYHEGGFEEGGLGRMSPYRWDRRNLNTDELDYLERMIKLCKEQGSEVVLISTPLPMATLLTLGNYDDVHAYFAKLAKANAAPYYDFNLVRDQRFARRDAYYFDTNHLNGQGAAAFSTVLGDALNRHRAGEDLSGWFYPDFSALARDYDRVANVYLQARTGGDAVTLTAKAYHGSGVQPEYRFLYREAGEGDYTVLRDFGPEPTAALTAQRKAGLEIRVEARAKGAPGGAVVFDSAILE